ncbi:MAG: asparagine synthase (glutamine-hydrolyzing) [Thermodesulfobacteriota bacterium]
MCGICGFYSRIFLENPEGITKKMLAPLLYRGPDEEGSHILSTRNGHVALGARRLAIVDPARGQQPLSSKNGTIFVVHNGEIYNHQELRIRLQKNHDFHTECDTEIILHAYEEYGGDCFSHFNGMFATAIYDHDQQLLTVARDRLGKKPLFYWHNPDFFCFSSELNSLLEFAKIPRQLNPSAATALFSFLCVPAPQTIYRDVFKLEPGQIIQVDQSGVRTKKYWHMPPPQPDDDHSQFSENFRATFFDAVSLRLQQGIPNGVLLSGGVDSTAVLNAAARFRSDLYCFTASFDNPSYDETRFAAQTADKAKASFIASRFCADISPLIDIMHERFGEPFGDSSFLPTYHICSQAAARVKVVLTGDGADELFGGYRKNQAAKLLQWLNQLPGGLIALAQRLTPGKSRMNKLFQAAHQSLSQSYINWESGCSDNTLLHVFSRDFLDAATPAESLLGQYFRDRTPLEGSLYADSAFYLPNDLLPKMDMASMANSIEARSPFLDYRLWEMVCRLPADNRVAPWQSKKLLKSSLRDLLPSQITRRPKQGFTVPLGAWVRDLLADPATNIFNSDFFLKRPIYNHRHIQSLIEAVEQPGPLPLQTTNMLWNTYILESWLQKTNTPI